MKSMKIMAMLAGLAASSESSNMFARPDQPALVPEKEPRKCKYSKCNVHHTHNNACCCAEHYKLWRKEKSEKDIQV